MNNLHLLWSVPIINLSPNMLQYSGQRIAPPQYDTDQHHLTGNVCRYALFDLRHQSGMIVGEITHPYVLSCRRQQHACSQFGQTGGQIPTNGSLRQSIKSRSISKLPRRRIPITYTANRLPENPRQPKPPVPAF